MAGSLKQAHQFFMFDGIGQGVLVECFDKGPLPLAQIMFELTGFGDFATVRAGIEAFNQIHIGLKPQHQVAELQILGRLGEDQAATFPLCAVDIAKLTQAVDDLHQVVAGNPEMISDFLDVAPSFGVHGQEH